MAYLTFKEILELIDRVADRGIGLVEVESSGLRVRIEGKPSAAASPVQRPSSSASSQGEAFTESEPPAEPAASGPVEESDEGLHVVTSPIVGTFYRSANPEAEPFVNVGDRVDKGDVICIIEAMKLMNEIEADFEGTVARIYPQNGQPIEYGEKLFAIRLG